MSEWLPWRPVATAGGEGPKLGDEQRREATESPYILPEMTTVEHLTELRYRLLVSGFAFVLCSVVGWFLVPEVLRVLSGFAGRLVFIAPAEAFFSYLRIALTVGLFVSSPVWFWQAWKFVLPALFPHERAVAARYLPVAIGLFVLGLIFAYLVIFPVALQFFLGFSRDDLRPALSIGRFLGFFLTMTLPFGFIFQIPLVLLIAVRLEMVSLAALRRNRKFVWFGAFVVGAVLTPPDPASQVLMAVPAVLLFEAALWIAGREAGKAKGTRKW